MLFAYKLIGSAAVTMNSPPGDTDTELFCTDNDSRGITLKGVAGTEPEVSKLN